MKIVCISYATKLIYFVLEYKMRRWIDLISPPRKSILLILLILLNLMSLGYFPQGPASIIKPFFDNNFPHPNPLITGPASSDNRVIMHTGTNSVHGILASKACDHNGCFRK